VVMDIFCNQKIGLFGSELRRCSIERCSLLVLEKQQFPHTYFTCWYILYSDWNWAFHYFLWEFRTKISHKQGKNILVA